jgi:thymidine kinase
MATETPSLAPAPAPATAAAPAPAPGHHGYLELILGSMFSGKTSYLLDVYKKCVFCDISVAVINYAADNRYTTEPMLSTHDKQMIPCILANTIQDAIQNHSETITRAETILINEGQFFPDIEEQVKQLVEQSNKRVYICGLDGDFERKPIGNLLQLVPFSDHIMKLKSLCSLCRDGTPGVFSFRTSSEIDQVVIGSSNYIPLCRGCYQKESSRKKAADSVL